MSTPRWPHPILALALVAASCAQPAVTPTGPGKVATGATGRQAPGPAAPAHQPTASAVPASAGPVAPVPGGALKPAASPITRATLAGTPWLPPDVAARVVSNNGGQLLANNGAGLVANDGAGLISDKGGSLVGKTKYSLRAAAPVRVAGLRVVLRDAGGELLRGPDGAALQAITDGEGRYAFTGALPTGAIVVAAPLGDEGEALAIAPAAAAPDQPRQLDLDLASTLASAYVLDKYVASQPARGATLDRLTPTAAAELHARAAEALGRVTVTPTFQRGAAVATVDALRTGDGAFAAQLEVVRKLLIPAGLSDLGAGRPAAEVALGEVVQVLPAGDGTYWIAAAAERRIWRLTGDRRMETVVGSGGVTTAEAEGQLGPEVGVDRLVGLALDEAGRPVWAERSDAGAGRVGTLRPDGTVRVVWANAPAPRALTVKGGDAYLLSAPDGGPATLWRRALGGGEPQKLAEFADAASRTLASARHLAVREDGAIWVETASQAKTFVNGALQAHPEIRRLDLAAGSAEPVADLNTVNAALGPAGEVLMARKWPAYGMTLRDVGGADTLVMEGHVPQLFWGFEGEAGVPLAAIAKDGDGAVAAFAAASGRYLVVRMAGDRLTHLAGRTGTPVGGSGVVGLADPAGIAIAADGTVYVADRGARQVRAIAPDGKAAVLDLPGQTTPDFGAGTLRIDAAGDLYLPHNMVLRFHPLGLITGYPDMSFDFQVHDFTVAPDGTFLVVGGDGRGVQVRPPGTSAPATVAVGPDGQVWVAGSGKLWRWTKAGGHVEAGADARWTFEAGETSALAVDARGRLILARAGANTVERWDPQAGSWTVLAGAGGKTFTGAGVDDGLSRPGFPAVAPNGDVFFSDRGHKQVKRIPAGE